MYLVLFCKILSNFCRNFVEKYTSASRKRVTHSRARHKGALRPRDKTDIKRCFDFGVRYVIENHIIDFCNILDSINTQNTSDLMEGTSHTFVFDLGIRRH